MQKKLTRNTVFITVKYFTVMFAMFGFIAGIIYSFGGLFIDTLVTLKILSGKSMGTPGLSYGTILAFGALIGMPAIFAIPGLILGLFVSAINKIRGTDINL